MSKNSMLGAIALMILIVGGFYTNCGSKSADDSSSVITSATLPGFTDSACNTPCNSLGGVGSQTDYNLYIFYVSGATCANTNASSTVAVKGILNTFFDGTTKLVNGGVANWKNNVANLAHGNYAQWFWLDTTSNGKLNANEPTGCTDIVVSGAAIGSQAVKLNNSASSADETTNLKFTY